MAVDLAASASAPRALEICLWTVGPTHGGAVDLGRHVIPLGQRCVRQVGGCNNQVAGRNQGEPQARGGTRPGGQDVDAGTR